MISYCSKYGYTDAFWYSLGKDVGAKFIGWRGNNSFEIEKIINDIAMMKTEDPIPKVTLKFKKEKSLMFLKGNIEYTQVRYPFGRCLKVKYPEKSKNATFNGIIVSQKYPMDIKHDSDNNSLSLIAYSVLLSDKYSGRLHILLIYLCRYTA